VEVELHVVKGLRGGQRAERLVTVAAKGVPKARFARMEDGVNISAQARPVMSIRTQLGEDRITAKVAKRMGLLDEAATLLLFLVWFFFGFLFRFLLHRVAGKVMVGSKLVTARIHPPVRTLRVRNKVAGGGHRLRVRVVMTLKWRQGQGS
jgi:hypothetical protein